MALDVKPLHPLFVGEVSGVDLSKPASDALIADVVAAMDRYAVLVFRGQKLAEDEQIAFTQRFGPLDLGLRKVTKTTHATRYAHEAMIDISNVGLDGNLADINSNKMYSQLANQLWHSDSSFQQPAARYSLLYSVVNPPKGGETEYTDLRAAYDALPDDTKALIANLRSEHYALYSRMNLGFTAYTEAEKNVLPPVEWPLVRTHPGSGRKVLWVGIHATRILDMHLGEGRLLLAELLEHATQREFVYRHQWRVGDLVMWDNRCTLHRGRRYDYTVRRELRRTTTEDLDLRVTQPA